MKKSIQFLFALLIGIILVSCGQSQKNSDTEESSSESKSTAAKSVDQLTWQDVVAMVFDDEGERIEWHGEEMPNDLTAFLVIANDGQPCGENDCGERTFLINTSNQTITTIIRGDYDIEGDVGYIPRKYVIGAGDTLMIGCSHLCYGGKGYEFPRTIVSSQYEEEVQ